MKFDAMKVANGHIDSEMDRELCFNYSGAFDPTAGTALNNVLAEERRKNNEDAWKKIALIEAKKRAFCA